MSTLALLLALAAAPPERPAGLATQQVVVMVNRPGFPGGSQAREAGANGKAKQVSEGAEGAVRLVLEEQSQYSWLRKERNLLSVAEDPTFQTLPS